MSGLSPTSLSPSCLGWVYLRNRWASDQIHHHAGTSPLGPTQPLVQAAPRCDQRHIAALCAGAMSAFHLLQTLQCLPAQPQHVGNAQNPTKPMKQEGVAGQALGSCLGAAILSRCSCSSGQQGGTRTGRAPGLPALAVLKHTWSVAAAVSDGPSLSGSSWVRRSDHNPQDLLQTGCCVECTAPVTSCHPHSHELLSCSLLTAEHLNAPRLAQGHG